MKYGEEDINQQNNQFKQTIVNILNKNIVSKLREMPFIGDMPPIYIQLQPLMDS